MDNEQQTHEKEGWKGRRLVEKLVGLELNVDTGLVKEIIQQEYIDDMLLEILKDDKYWTAGGPGKQWTPYHVLYILGLKADEKSVEAIGYAMKNRLEETGDFVTEELPSVLYPAACKIPDKVWGLAIDKTLDVYARISAVRAVCATGLLNEELNKGVVDKCKKFLATETDGTLIGLTLGAIAELKDKELWGLVKETYEKTIFAQDVHGWQDIEELHAGTFERPDHIHATHDLWHHFSEENLDDLYADSFETGYSHEKPVERRAKKTGRNEPFPCGSDKKYKKCCGKNG